VFNGSLTSFNVKQNNGSRYGTAKFVIANRKKCVNQSQVPLSNIIFNVNIIAHTDIQRKKKL